VEGIQAIKEEENEEEYEGDDHTLVTSDVEESLVIRRAFMPKRFPFNLTKGSKSSTPDALWEARYANSSLVEVVAPMWLLQHSLKSFKSPPRYIPPLILFNGSSTGMR